MTQGTDLALYRPKPSDLTAFLPFACRQLEASFHLRIVVETIEDKDKDKKSKRDNKMTPHAQASTVVHYASEKEISASELEDDDVTEVVLHTRCDPAGKPLELLFHRCVRVSRLLMKIIGLCIPYHEQLTKIIIRGGPLDGSVVYEIAKFLPVSQVTELCLDDSSVPQRNYYLLLERPSRLRCLSLARCNLADEDCAALAARLVHPLPSSRSLAVLSLESNRIRDAGAGALGEALRTNRSLRHLNLAGNAITSLGAAHIIRSLAAFPVSNDDMIQKGRRTFDYLKLRRDTYARCYRELTETADQLSDGGRWRRRTTVSRSRKGSSHTLTAVKHDGEETLADRVDAMVVDLIGVRSTEPFDRSELVQRGGALYCAGNFNLASLNLAYNNLDCTSAGRLAEVLTYQAGAGLSPGQGLLRVVLEGNAISATCAAMRTVETFLEITLAAVTTTTQLKTVRKNERTRVKIT